MTQTRVGRRYVMESGVWGWGRPEEGWPTGFKVNPYTHLPHLKREGGSVYIGTIPMRLRSGRDMPESGYLISAETGRVLSRDFVVTIGSDVSSYNSFFGASNDDVQNERRKWVFVLCESEDTKTRIDMVEAATVETWYRRRGRHPTTRRWVTFDFPEEWPLNGHREPQRNDIEEESDDDSEAVVSEISMALSPRHRWEYSDSESESSVSSEGSYERWERERQEELEEFVNQFWDGVYTGNGRKVADAIDEVDIGPCEDYTEALIHACTCGYTDVVEALLKDDNTDKAARDNLPIQIAAQYGYYRIVELLLNTNLERPSFCFPELNRFDPTARNNYALRTAADNGYDEVVRLLLEDGRADPRAYRSEALRNARREKHQKVIDLLLKDGRADPDAYDRPHKRRRLD